MLKSYLFEGKKRIAYITGNYLYNQLGLTTQVGKQLQIASRSKRIIVKTALVNAKPVMAYVDVTDENYILLGILEGMKYEPQLLSYESPFGVGYLTMNFKL